MSFRRTALSFKRWTRHGRGLALQRRHVELSHSPIFLCPAILDTVSAFGGRILPHPLPRSGALQMKLSGRLAIPLSVLFAFAACSRACGPFFTEAVFVQRTGPDGPYAAYVGGRSGGPHPGY